MQSPPSIRGAGAAHARRDRRARALRAADPALGALVALDEPGADRVRPRLALSGDPPAVRDRSREHAEPALAPPGPRDRRLDRVPGGPDQPRAARRLAHRAQRGQPAAELPGHLLEHARAARRAGHRARVPPHLLARRTASRADPRGGGRAAARRDALLHLLARGDRRAARSAWPCTCSWLAREGCSAARSRRCRPPRCWSWSPTTPTSWTRSTRPRRRPSRRAIASRWRLASARPCAPGCGCSSPSAWIPACAAPAAGRG